MFRVAVAGLFGGMVLLAGGVVGQEPKARGFLPQNWAKIGLSDDQKQQVYKIQGKFGDEIEKLEAKIREAKAARDKEMLQVLTADQKKKLEEIFKSKAGTGN